MNLINAIRLKYYKLKIQFRCAFKYHSYNGNVRQFMRDLIFD